MTHLVAAGWIHITSEAYLKVDFEAIYDVTALEITIPSSERYYTRFWFVLSINRRQFFGIKGENGQARLPTDTLHAVILLTFTFRVFYSDDGYVWTAYNSRLSSTDLGQVFERQTASSTVEFDPPIRVSDYVHLRMITEISATVNAESQDV